MLKTSASLDGELAFLNVYRKPAETLLHRSSRFLMTPFDVDIWQFKFNETVFEVDFRVRLDDGSLLTAQKNSQLCTLFKSWLCVHESPEVTQGRVPAAEPSKYKVHKTLHLIDYFLLNAGRLRLGEYGLQAFTANDMNGLLLALASAPRAHISLYSWPTHLKQFLLKKCETLTAWDIAAATQDQPDLADPSDEDNALMDLNPPQLLQARVWLWINGYYRRRGIQDHKFSPELSRIADEVYQDTLFGRKKPIVAPELFITLRDRNDREKPRAPTYADGDTSAALHHFNSYVRVLKSLEPLYLAGLKVPLLAVQSLEENAIRQCADLRRHGRHRTLPQKLVLDSLRNALEFSLKYGDALVDGYLKIIKAWKAADMSFLAFSVSPAFNAALSPSLITIGVKTWAIKPFVGHHKTDRTYQMPSSEYFSRFRQNEGLFELLRVLYGCVYVSVGALMARRSGELDELYPSRCLDPSGRYLRFENRKSGVVDLRQTEERPIPPVAARLIKMLCSLQHEARTLGLLPQERLLFAGPRRTTGLPADGVETDTAVILDMFCDYFELPTNSVGERYYLRQHQFRRFFAILFFWGGSLGGLDTLRWFLGHTDVEHIWHYVTESIPGEALVNVKVGFTTEQVLSGAPIADELIGYLRKRYGVSDFAVLDIDELSGYVQTLMEEGSVDVEPHFLDLPGGKSYQIHIIVKPKGSL